MVRYVDSNLQWNADELDRTDDRQHGEIEENRNECLLCFCALFDCHAVDVYWWVPHAIHLPADQYPMD
jgi:hypothetical protein